MEWVKRICRRALRLTKLDWEVHLLLVPHGALAQDGHLGHGLLLEPLQRVALGPEDLAHKVKLKANKGYSFIE